MELFFKLINLTRSKYVLRLKSTGIGIVQKKNQVIEVYVLVRMQN